MRSDNTQTKWGSYIFPADNLSLFQSIVFSQSPLYLTYEYNVGAN